MDFKEAMSARHTVRKYKDTPLPAEIIAKLIERVAANNDQLGLGISLVTNNTEGLPGIVKLILASESITLNLVQGKKTLSGLNAGLSMKARKRRISL